MVVSMRIFNKKDINKVKQISENFSFAHGDPIHIGDPIEIGITNILSPDWGDSPRKKNDDEAYSDAPLLSSSLVSAILSSATTFSPGVMFMTLTP